MQQVVISTRADGPESVSVFVTPAPSLLLGLDGSLAELVAAGEDDDGSAADSQTAVAAEQAADVPRYAVQTGAYGDATNAAHMAEQLAQAGTKKIRNSLVFVTRISL